VSQLTHQLEGGKRDDVRSALTRNAILHHVVHPSSYLLNYFLACVLFKRFNLSKVRCVFPIQSLHTHALKFYQHADARYGYDCNMQFRIVMLYDTSL
jgi:hypothetical protein